MRLLHTADWHLGRTLGGHSLHQDPEFLFAGQFLAMVRDTRPDAVLIAGDIFDRSVPPADAVELLDDILHRLIVGLRTPVVLIPGNHDDARRLAFGARLLAGGGLHIADSPLGRAREFHDAHGPVSIVASGYASPLLLAQKLPAEDHAMPGTGADQPPARVVADQPTSRVVADHDQGMALLAPLLHALCPPNQRRVLVAHAFVAGGSETESERGLSVGGTGQISAARFAGFHYVALGHLHRPQSLAEGRLRYSGSPLAYSTSEADQQKSVTLVELDAQGGVTTQELPLTPLHPLRILRGDLATLLAGTSQDYLALELTDPLPIAEAQRRLAQNYPRIIGLRWVAETLPATATALPAAARTLSPLQQFEAFHQAMRGAPLPDAARPVVTAALTSAEQP
jgi:exonuclease SbcD